jgi:hypothetical protein
MGAACSGIEAKLKNLKLTGENLHEYWSFKQDGGNNVDLSLQWSHEALVQDADSEVTRELYEDRDREAFPYTQNSLGNCAGKTNAQTTTTCVCNCADMDCTDWSLFDWNQTPFQDCSGVSCFGFKKAWIDACKCATATAAAMGAAANCAVNFNLEFTLRIFATAADATAKNVLKSYPLVTEQITVDGISFGIWSKQATGTDNAGNAAGGQVVHTVQNNLNNKAWPNEFPWQNDVDTGAIVWPSGGYEVVVDIVI